MTTSRRVLDSIDDAMAIRSRHPVLSARAAARGLTCRDLTELYDAWLVGSWQLPSWACAFNASPATRRRAAQRRGRTPRKRPGITRRNPSSAHRQMEAK